MPVSSSPSTSRRLLALLSLLQSARDWSAPALAVRLQVSERTVRRDVERLRELDYAIEATRGPDGGYRLGAGADLPPLLLDEEQAVAVALALQSAGTLGADVEEAAARALGTLRRLLPSRVAHRVASLSPATAVPERGTVAADPAVLLQIGEAIRARRELRFDYDSPARRGPSADGGAGPRVTEPHHLLLHAGRWYLLGRTRGDWRVYRVDRIAPRTHDGRAFAASPVPGGDPARFLVGRFRGSADGTAWPCRGEATLAVPLTTVAPFVGDGTAEAVGPDRCRVTLESWSWGALAAGFLRFEAEVDDVEPLALRTAFHELGRRAVVAAQPPSGGSVP